MKREKMRVGELLQEGYKILKSVQIDSYQLDTELLLGKVIKKDRLFMLLNRDYEVDCDEAEQYFSLIEKRKSKMPIKYMLGECEFMGIPFYIREGVLIPRPDTEVLVETAIDEIKQNSYKKLCDVCCGSGIIGISIVKFVDYIEAKCSDISEVAYEVTSENIKRLNIEDRVKVEKGNLLQGFIDRNEKFDIIVSNPPYIRGEVIETLMEDVKNYEPYQALYGGEDGLDFYRSITEQSLKVLVCGGVLIFEIGHDQGEEVGNILRQNGFSDVVCIKDLAGKDRVVKGKFEIGCEK